MNLYLPLGSSPTLGGSAHTNMGASADVETAQSMYPYSSGGWMRVWENAGILLANLLQSSKSTFSWRCFLSFFAFKHGILDTQISALGG
jgi:hypothetical protein